MQHNNGSFHSEQQTDFFVCLYSTQQVNGAIRPPTLIACAWLFVLLSSRSLPFSCLYTTSSSDPSLLNRISWVMLVSWPVMLKCVCLLRSAEASRPMPLGVRMLHLPQKVMKPPTAIKFRTNKTFHLLDTQAIKDVGVLKPIRRI